MNALKHCAYLYARVKATMTLRTSGDLSRPSGLRLGQLRLPAVLAGAAVLLLTMFAGGSPAGVPEYQGTLYFAGPASSVSGSYRLTTAAPGPQGAAPIAGAGAPNSGGVPTGNYKYVYVTSSGGALTASPASSQVSVTNAPVTVTNIPIGADVYRSKIPSGTATGVYILIGTAAAVPYLDTSTATTGPLLPQADTRVATGATGWAAFNPGVSLASSIANTMPLNAMTPAIPSSCKGWTVDAPGGMTFPAGPWTFDAQIKPDASLNGAAVLTVAMWKVDDSGNTVSGGTVIPPTDGGAIDLTLGASQTVSVSYTTSGVTTLAANEHLCVQFWRHQGTAYSGGGATTHTIAMLAWDPNTKISTHPAPNAFATAALASPAAGLHTQTIPTLGATYSDSEGDAGTLTIRLCGDSGCSAPVDSGAMAATNGATLTWTPSGPLADGTYYWDARAQDGLGLPSAWTSQRTFFIDNAPPTVTIGSSPPAQSNAPSGSFSFSANETVTGYQCRVDGALFAACSSPHGYGPLADGLHTFDVKAVADLAGNAGTTTSYSWTIDTVPPNTSITSSPSALSNTPNPSFGLSATQSGSSFECSLDGTGFTSCPNPQTYSGVSDGAHTLQARAIDPAGNTDASPASYSWTIDATPPDTTIGPSQPAPLTIATGATFDFFSEPGATFQCKLDGGSFSACSSPKTYSALNDGSHTFQVRANDVALNTDPSPASYSWTIDTIPPITSIGPTVPPANTSSASATFDLASNEGGSSFACRLDAAAFGACTTPASYSGLADGTHTFEVRATDQIGNVDTSPASYSWRIDNVAPSTPLLTTPADGSLTGALPQLGATFDDATSGGDTGTVEFQLCSTSAPAGTACVPVVQSFVSGSVSSGRSASGAAAALPDGTYYWQARARDVSGNQSGWSATSSFQLDTQPPAVPTLGDPADGALVRAIELSAMFSKPSFAGTGSVEFRLCSDALCLGVIQAGSSAMVSNGGLAFWSPRWLPRDGLYYWQARATDSAGNQSVWSDARTLNLKGPPLAVRVKPTRFVCGRGSVLRLRVHLSAPAVVRNRLLNRRGRLVKRGLLGTLRGGTSRVRIKLPRGLRRGRYRLVLDATGSRGTAHAFVRVKVGSRSCHPR